MVWPCASMIIGTRRTMPSRSGLIVNRPRPAAACSSTLDVAQQAREFEHEALRLLAQHRESRSPEASCRARPALPRPPNSPSTTRDCRIASAKIWSLLGSARSLARVSSSRLRNVSAASAGLSRSGSENTASKAITTAPSLVSSVTRSAIRVRGHGHWPSFSRLLSSISTMVTGLLVFSRGSMRWKTSKVLTRISSTGAGSATRKGGKPDQQRKAQQPGIADAPREPSSQYPQSFHGFRMFDPANGARQVRR